MQLSEAEIEQILNDYWPGRDDDTDRSEAAHAIAEKLKEGVVWERKIEASWRESYPLIGNPSEILDLSPADGSATWIKFFEPKRAGITKDTIEHGQLVTVTVSKKEETWPSAVRGAKDERERIARS